MTVLPIAVLTTTSQFRFLPDCGIIADFRVLDQGREIALMHRAPWVDAPPVLPPDAPPHQARLEGDFFCAPFADASTDAAPLHGWPANSSWTVLGPTDRGRIRCALDRPVMGARLTKELTLHPDQPFLYQSHVFSGGSGTLSCANHAMVSLPQGGVLRFSPKRWFETAASAPEADPSRGRSCLKYPAQSADPRQFPAADGGHIDLTRYPFGPAHEDFVMAVEAPESPLGWTAVTRPVEGDLFVSLRNPRQLPMTMLWHSNGGRDYAPWSGRHRSCLGIEEGVATTMLGQAGPGIAQLLARSGQASAIVLAPGRVTEVRHVTGAMAWPSGEPVRDIRLEANRLTITGEAGASRRLPIKGVFLDIRP